MVADQEPLTFGRLLRAYRQAAGLTQQALADKADVSRRGIEDLERGVRLVPQHETLRRLVIALALSAEDAARLAAAAVRRPKRALVLLPQRGEQGPESGTKLGDDEATRAVRPRIPTPLTPLLGRERELAALNALVRRESVRLVTITGAGGTGKTRLALQVAADVQDAFPDGVWYIRLSRISDPQLVIPTIASALDVRAQGTVPLTEALQRYLQDRQALLLLDNFEQVADAAVAVGELLEYCANVTALVTSRVSLRLRGEHRYALHPLATPDPQRLPGSEHLAPERLAEHAAVALFVERAQAVHAESAIPPDALPAVAEICARLDGLPLAIELAAARTKLLKPAALLARLQRALPVLEGGTRDMEHRQQTMRSALAWSYDLLTPMEQRLFRRLAVFVGGWTLEAAEAVCSAPEGAEPVAMTALDGLERLFEHSLVQVRDEECTARFGMLHVIREFALEQLEASEEAEALRRAHATYHMLLVERLQIELREEDPRPPLERVKVEQDNVRAALAWACERADALIALRLAAAMGQLWIQLGLGAESGKWAQMALALPVDPALASDTERRRLFFGARIQVAFWAGHLAKNVNDLQPAEVYFEEVVAIGRETNTTVWLVGGLTALAEIAFHTGDVERTRRLVEETLVVARAAGRSGSARTHLEALNGVGFLLSCAGDDERADAIAEEMLQVAADTSLSWYQTPAHALLAYVAFYRGDLARAQALAVECLSNALATGKWSAGFNGLIVLAGVRSQRGAMEETARLVGVLDSYDTLAAFNRCPREQAIRDTAAATARAALVREAWEAAYARGRALPLEEAIAEAIAEALGEEMAQITTGK